MSAPVEVSTYVALGDSLVHGAGCPSWCDHVAAGLERRNPALRYRNLGVVGATAEDVAGAPLDEAVALQPDFVTVMCGANDVLLSTRPDVERFRDAFERIVGRLLSETSARVATGSYPDGARYLPLRPRTLARVVDGLEQVNATIVEVSERLGAFCVQGHRNRSYSVEGEFGRDGFHPSAEGHRKIYRVVADQLHANLGIDARGALDEGREQAA